MPCLNRFKKKADAQEAVKGLEGFELLDLKWSTKADWIDDGNLVSLVLGMLLFMMLVLFLYVFVDCSNPQKFIELGFSFKYFVGSNDASDCPDRPSFRGSNGQNLRICCAASYV